jgi:predicted ATPase
MVYLEQFRFPTVKKEDSLLNSVPNRYDYASVYPFRTLSNKQLKRLDFEPITLLVGGNGSGKSTALNVIAAKLRVIRMSAFDTSDWFDRYVNLCSHEMEIGAPTLMLTSDDIFKMMQENRTANVERLTDNRLVRKSITRVKSGEAELPKRLDFETGESVREYQEMMKQRKLSYNQYFTQSQVKVERGCSNGECSLNKLSELIRDGGLFLLDEPENSMACDFQLQLAEIIEDAARSGNCQFIIATHSPFLMSIPFAKIYCMDDNPVTVKKWWQVESMRSLYDLFMSHENEFENE